MKYPNASCFISIPEFLIYNMEYTLEESGGFIKEVCTALVNGTFEDLEKFPFVHNPRYGSKRKIIPLYVRKKVLECGVCKFCGETKNLCIDHIIPVCKSGTNDIENLQCLCAMCNARKAGKLL